MLKVINVWLLYNHFWTNKSDLKLNCLFKGGENDVLNTIKFDKIDIETFTIEHNGNEVERQKMIKTLTANKYKQLKSDGQDIYFKKEL